jgi:hypothetical protein
LAGFVMVLQGFGSRWHSVAGRTRGLAYFGYYRLPRHS